jgi:hypothetical protein
VAPSYTTPRTLDRPTYGPAVGRIAAALGWPPIPWQTHAANLAGEIDPATGDPAFSVVVVCVQRQAGKTAQIGPTALQRMTVTPNTRCWYTAQTRQDARDTWLDVATRVRQSELVDGVAIRYGNGSETIDLVHNGSFFRVFAPNEDALHGKANRLVVIDEAWTVTEPLGAALEQAILPTFNTVPGQLMIVSAAGDSTSTWFRRWVDLGRAAALEGRTTGIAYLEYGIPDDADATDVDTILAYHPAAGHTLRRAAVEDAAERMTPAGFARAYGNRWSLTLSRVISAAVWAGSMTGATLPPGVPLAFGADVAADRSAGSIVAAAGGILELVDRRDGVEWIAPRLRELHDRHKPAAIALDAYGPAATVVDELQRAELASLLIPSTRDYATGCADLIDALATGRRRHRPDPRLDAAVAAATTRTVGDSWVWGRRTSAGQIDALVALTLASWAVDHAAPPAPPRPRPVVYAG